ncbi:MAG: peptide chain release factor 1 [Alphaproteobacteria bacterium]|jgi:peptide chain release factor 1
MISNDKMAQIIDRFEELENLLSQGMSNDFIKLSKEYADLKDVVIQIKRLQALNNSLADLQEMMQDPELSDIAEQEYYAAKKTIPELEHAIQIALLPKDAADERSAILEIRAGTGGDEAAIFAGDLFKMYERYATINGWKTEIVSEAVADHGGFKEIIANVTGQGVFARLKFESGAHRVQRVPVTESGGRVHTSAATVAVMPQATEVDITIHPDDLRIDVFRASGAGGQHVNKTESAVRVTHLPTGVAVAIQEEKSQHKNKARAMDLLYSRLYDAERQRLADERAADRKGQIGSGDRSERIRTYNYSQGRVTDHRINLTLYSLDEIIAGDGLDGVINPLIAEDQSIKLAGQEEN